MQIFLPKSKKKNRTRFVSCFSTFIHLEIENIWKLLCITFILPMTRNIDDVCIIIGDCYRKHGYVGTLHDKALFKKKFILNFLYYSEMSKPRFPIV